MADLEFGPTIGDLSALVQMVPGGGNRPPTYVGLDFALRLLLVADAPVEPSNLMPWLRHLKMSDAPQSVGSALLSLAKRSPTDAAAILAAWSECDAMALDLLKCGDLAAAWRAAIFSGVALDVLPATVWAAALAYNSTAYEIRIGQWARRRRALHPAGQDGGPFMLVRAGGSYKRMYFGHTGTTFDAILTNLLHEEALTVHSVGMLQAAALCYRRKWCSSSISVANRILTRLWKQVTPYMFAASSVWVSAALWSALFGTAPLWHQHTETETDCGYFQSTRGYGVKTTLRQKMHSVEFNPQWARRAAVSPDTQRAYDYMANPAVVSQLVGERILTVCILRKGFFLPTELINLIATYSWGAHDPAARWQAHLKAQSRIIPVPGRDGWEVLKWGGVE